MRKTCSSYARDTRYVLTAHTSVVHTTSSSASMSSDRKPRPEGTFAELFRKWMSGLQDFLPLLLSAATDTCLGPPKVHDRHLRAVIAKLTARHKQYYTEKWVAAAVDKGGNVFLYFFPLWKTLLERAYSLMTGWKPSMAFKLVDTLRAGPGLSPFGGLFGEVSEEQAKGIERLRHEEDKVERDMERLQETQGIFGVFEIQR